MKSIHSLLDGSIFINQNATKSNFMNHAQNNGIIHLSAHSFVDYNEPVNSAILLHKADKHSDNLVSLSDVAKQNYSKTQLVTLSACNSSNGHFSESNGVSSLTKTFFEAGSQSVLGSYWSVPDQYTKIFMEAFYSNLKKGMKKDEALRKVKIDLIDGILEVNPAYMDPAFWSAWVLFGNTDPIISDKFNALDLWYLIIGFVALLFCLWYWKKRG